MFNKEKIIAKYFIPKIPDTIGVKLKSHKWPAKAEHLRQLTGAVWYHKNSNVPVRGRC